MTLKERYLEKAFCMCEDESQIDIFVNIADDYAIVFAEWLVIRYNEDIIFDEYTTKELLQIYKKEKGL